MLNTDFHQSEPLKIGDFLGLFESYMLNFLLMVNKNFSLNFNGLPWLLIQDIGRQRKSSWWCNFSTSCTKVLCWERKQKSGLSLSRHSVNCKSWDVCFSTSTRRDVFYGFITSNTFRFLLLHTSGQWKHDPHYYIAPINGPLYLKLD